MTGWVSTSEVQGKLKNNMTNNEWSRSQVCYEISIEQIFGPIEGSSSLDDSIDVVFMTALVTHI